MKPYSEHSRFELFKLVKRREGNFWIVGNPETEIYVRIPEKGYELLELFERGYSVSEIRKISREHLGRINVDSFIKNLIRHEFVKSIDGNPLKIESKRNIIEIFRFIKPKHVRWLFSEEAYLVYAFIISFALGILISNPSYFPKMADYFFTESMSKVVIISFLTGWLLVFLHELAHMLACRSYNLKASFGITNRLYYLVAITDVTNVYSIKREKRYRVFLAGIATDLLIASASIVILYLSGIGAITLSQSIVRFLKFVVLLEAFGIAWQFYFFLKTDIYYAFENLTEVNNLHKKAQLLLRQFFQSFIHGKKHHHFRQHYQSLRERNIVLAYAIFYALGYLVSMCVLVFYGIPIAARLLSWAFSSLMKGAVIGNPAIFYDAIILLSFWLINQALLLYALIKRYKLNMNPMLYWFFIALLITTNYLIVLVITALLLNKITSTFLLLSSMAILGFAFAFSLIKLGEKLNSLGNEVIVPVMIPVLSIVVAFIIYGFSRAVISGAGIILARELLVLMPITYVLGSAVCYLISFRINKAYD
ncbi:MAG: hypothetical protein QXW00_04200 [Candidatus Woesearchaeota archaeon]